MTASNSSHSRARAALLFVISLFPLAACAVSLAYDAPVSWWIVPLLTGLMFLGMAAREYARSRPSGQ